MLSVCDIIYKNFLQYVSFYWLVVVLKYCFVVLVYVYILLMWGLKYFIKKFVKIGS